MSLSVANAPARFVEIMYAQNPEALKEPTVWWGSKFSVVRALSDRIKKSETTDDFRECMKILEVLLVDANLDLLEIDMYDDRQFSNFAMLSNATHTAHHDLKQLTKTIIEKRGEEELTKCVHWFTEKIIEIGGEEALAKFVQTLKK